MAEDTHERLDRLESILEGQQATIADQRETIAEQQAAIDALRERLTALDERAGTGAEPESDGELVDSEDGIVVEDDASPDTGDDRVQAAGESTLTAVGAETVDEADPSGSVLATGWRPGGIEAVDVPATRRTLATAGLLGAGALGAGLSSAQGSPPGTPGRGAQGQVGTGGRPLQTLYTQAVGGPITGGTEVADLLGDGLTVADDALTADLATGLEFDGGAVGLDLDAIAGENLSPDPATGELDAAAGGSHTGASAYLRTDEDTSGETQVPLDAVSYDAGNDFDTATGTYTVPESGIYSVTFKTYTDAHLLSLHVNGSSRVNAEPPMLSKTLQLSAGDTIAAYVDGGGTVYGGLGETYLTVDRLG